MMGPVALMPLAEADGERGPTAAPTKADAGESSLRSDRKSCFELGDPGLANEVNRPEQREHDLVVLTFPGPTLGPQGGMLSQYGVQSFGRVREMWCPHRTVQ